MKRCQVKYIEEMIGILNNRINVKNTNCIFIVLKILNCQLKMNKSTVKTPKLLNIKVLLFMKFFII